MQMANNNNLPIKSVVVTSQEQCQGLLCVGSPQQKSVVPIFVIARESAGLYYFSSH